ncbi:hypothetical protein AAFF_G00255110 [Aldrovandia affinis]|uniref:Uncharacterized protein n=1 Tax=Aldrovandia affinis TaxID=143900 RepID=A0AAD7RCQ4_9TELE|nr:hypothetical protein AAFF_G00255110 [Aldrovandia affinis]
MKISLKCCPGVLLDLRPITQNPRGQGGLCVGGAQRTGFHRAFVRHMCGRPCSQGLGSYEPLEGSARKYSSRRPPSDFLPWLRRSRSVRLTTSHL